MFIYKGTEVHDYLHSEAERISTPYENQVAFTMPACNRGKEGKTGVIINVHLKRGITFKTLIEAYTLITNCMLFQ